jgi:hypothetical protein
VTDEGSNEGLRYHSSDEAPTIDEGSIDSLRYHRSFEAATIHRRRQRRSMKAGKFGGIIHSIINGDQLAARGSTEREGGQPKRRFDSFQDVRMTVATLRVLSLP